MGCVGMAHWEHGGCCGEKLLGASVLHLLKCICGAGLLCSVFVALVVSAKEVWRPVLPVL